MKRCMILIIALGCFEPALACMCANASIEDQYAEAVNVFRARTKSVHIKPVPKHLKGNSWLNPPGSGDGSRVVQATFELLETYKGSPQRLKAVYTLPDRTIGCGLRITNRSEYVFFADAKGIVSMCGGNARRRLFGKKFRNTIKELKRILSQQSSHETAAITEAPRREENLRLGHR